MSILLMSVLLMTLYEFNILPDNIQYQTIFDIGRYLDSRVVDDHCKINLYSIDMFYVEVYFDTDINAVIKNVSFKYGDRLNYYSNIRTSI